MSNTPSKLNHQPLRSVRRMAHAALLLILSACSGSAVSLGSGIDDTDAALTDDPSGHNMGPNGMPVNCATNPLGTGCPVAEEDPCGQAVSDCYADVLTSGDDPTRCHMLSAACSTSGSSEPGEMPVDCGLQFNDCLVETMASGEGSARCEMQLEGCRSTDSSEPGGRVDCGLQFNDCLAETMASGEGSARCEMQLEGCRRSPAAAQPDMGR